MKILKFGGTSVGSPERLRRLLEIISPTEEQIIVLSAIAGTTNNLVEIASAYQHSEDGTARALVLALHLKYDDFVRSVYRTRGALERALEILDDHFTLLSSFTAGTWHVNTEKVVLAQGELLSTKLFTILLQEEGIKAVLLPALDFMRIDEDGEPVMSWISTKLGAVLDKHRNENLFITQGFICLNAFGAVDNLKRGGSDYTASLIGAALRAEEIQIWTDIDGMHNNDPRIVPGTRPVADISFAEAAELAYFGAKILHPQSVIPAQRHHIPVRLLNTLMPQQAGTLISDKRSRGLGEITSIAAKDGIVAIKVQSSRMLLAFGFLRRVFEVFERYRSPIDMITTSEVAVSLTIDHEKNLEAIIDELRAFGTVEVDKGQSIICVVGDFLVTHSGIVAKVLNCIPKIPLRMVSYGGSSNNMSILVASEDKVEALQALHRGLFTS